MKQQRKMQKANANPKHVKIMDYAPEAPEINLGT